MTAFQNSRRFEKVFAPPWSGKRRPRGLCLLRGIARRRNVFRAGRLEYPDDFMPVRGIDVRRRSLGFAVDPLTANIVVKEFRHGFPRICQDQNRRWYKLGELP